MKLKEFLFERKNVILINLVGIGALFSYLKIFNIPELAIFFIITCWIFVYLCYLLLSFIKRRNYYIKLHAFIESEEDLSTLTNLVPNPKFPDITPFYEYLELLNEDIQIKANDNRNERINYQEYVESWVHDIKTPIATIKLILETDVKDEVYKDELAEELDKIEQLVEQTLYYARSENVEKDYLVKELPVMKCVKNSILSNSALILKNGIAIDVKNNGETIFSDEKWLNFILNQILINSIKYSKAEGSIIKIWVNKKSDSIILSIEDNGIGIPKSDLNRVFDKGFTGKSGRKYQKSTGIGLYLVKKLCEKLQHGVYIESIENEFTRVSIVFPKSNFINF